MLTCPNCGSQNNEGDRFCSSCGTNIENVGSSDTPSSSTPEPPESTTAFPSRGASIPPPVDFSPSPGASVEEEWRMSNLGPPPKRKRSIWVWILIGVIALCVLSCVGLIGFSLTDTGQRWIEDLATEAAIQATEAAGG